MAAVEAFTNAALGLFISWAVTYYALPLWGFTPGPGEAATITACYFVVSFLRSWMLRLIFARIA